MTRLLREAWTQAKEKLEAVQKAVAEGMYRIERKRLYAPDGWIYVNRTMRIPINGVTAKARFPDVLKLPRERLELLQLGWRASDEGKNGGRPLMQTTQPWQAFAWVALRHGELYIRVASVTLTRQGISINVYFKAKSWRQRWGKDEAISLVADYLRRGEWAPMLTMWLGDGKIMRGVYMIIVATKEPWRLGIYKGVNEALVAKGREAFVKLREAAGAHGELLNLLRAHKWIVVKRATETVDKQNKNSITVEGVVMYLELMGGRGGSLIASYFTRDSEKALTVAKRLKSSGLRPNIVKSNANYVVYITMTDLLRLAERDDEIRRTIALYLAKKAKNGTPRQREIAEKILKRHPFFYPFNRLSVLSKLVLLYIIQFRIKKLSLTVCGTAELTITKYAESAKVQPHR
jgi:hypothetical protein